MKAVHLVGRYAWLCSPLAANKIWHDSLTTMVLTCVFASVFCLWRVLDFPWVLTVLLLLLWPLCWSVSLTPGTIVLVAKVLLWGSCLLVDSVRCLFSGLQNSVWKCPESVWKRHFNQYNIVNGILWLLLVHTSISLDNSEITVWHYNGQFHSIWDIWQ